MSLQRLTVELSQPLPGKYLANCALCAWELWTRVNGVQDEAGARALLQDSWSRHAKQKHGVTQRDGNRAQGRLV